MSVSDPRPSLPARAEGQARRRSLHAKILLGLIVAAALGLALLVALSACATDSPGAPSEPQPQVATVLFTYRSPVPENPPPLTDPDLLAAVTGCVHHFSAFGGVYVLEGSWSLDASYRNPAGDCREGCTLVVAGIPVGAEQVVRMRDLDLCVVDPLTEPISFESILANGVELSRIVDHPSGMRGVAFRVAANGTVTP